MTRRITCTSMQIHTTSVCTLKCAKCGFSFPMFDVPLIADIEKTIAALEKLFEVYDFIHEVRFAGAESFLYPELPRLMAAVAKYSEQFDYAITITNGTYIPQQSLIDCMKGLPYPFTVRVDNYGKLSRKYDELISTLRANGIEVDERNYTGENQAYGGWIDYGGFDDRHYSDEELKKVFYNCRNPDDCGLLVNDVLTNCGYVTIADYLGKAKMKERDVVYLLGNQSVEEMRKKVLAWRDEPFEACKYCNGFDPVNSPRIPAAEQLL